MAPATRLDTLPFELLGIIIDHLQCDSPQEFIFESDVKEASTLLRSLNQTSRILRYCSDYHRYGLLKLEDTQKSAVRYVNLLSTRPEVSQYARNILVVIGKYSILSSEAVQRAA